VRLRALRAKALASEPGGATLSASPPPSPPPSTGASADAFLSGFPSSAISSLADRRHHSNFDTVGSSRDVGSVGAAPPPAASRAFPLQCVQERLQRRPAAPAASAPAASAPAASEAAQSLAAARQVGFAAAASLAAGLSAGRAGAPAGAGATAGMASLQMPPGRGLSLARANTANLVAARFKQVQVQAAQTREARVKEKRKELRLRSQRVYYLRQSIAWGFNLFVLIFLLALIRIYASMFGERGTQDLMRGWMISIGTATAVIEPVNVIVLAALPLLMRGDGPIAKCYNNIFWCYNELFA